MNTIKTSPPYPCNTDLEVADIFRFNEHKLPFLDYEERKVVNAIISCRTSILGGHILKCDNCSYMEISYNSCRNRHCPKCQSLSKARWILNRDAELLPVHYFHLVFTIPSIFNSITLCNKRVIYEILFRAVSETIKEVAANPDNLGAQTGFFAVLHTWDQQLMLHPHIHCIVPGGGFSQDKSRWIQSPKNYFVSVKKLSIVFRGKFLSYLEQAFTENELYFPANLSAFNDALEFKKLLGKSCASNWVVYSKPPFSGPFGVVRYLGRYTHRIAISNDRLTSMTDNTVTFKWKDRKNGNTTKPTTMDVVLFMKRFLYHVLPHRFTRIRYYGFMANAHRKENIRLARELLGISIDESSYESIPENWQNLMILLTGKDPTLCPKCKEGHIRIEHEFGTYRRQRKERKVG